jgi:hypothetical protein
MVAMKSGQFITYSYKFINQTLAGFKNRFDRQMKSKYKSFQMQKKLPVITQMGKHWDVKDMCFHIKTGNS